MTEPHVVVITGGAGFLGSALTVDLARSHRVVAIDRRRPGAALLRAAPDVLWQTLDIADATGVTAAFDDTKERFGRVDFVLHFAAFYHFGSRWLPQYQRTNVQGTTNVLEAAANAGARRLIFASSIAAMEPPPPGQMLDERSPTAEGLPYGKSKSIGEAMVEAMSDRLPAIVLRIGGAFSNWCELPLLYSLIELWRLRSPLGRLVVGRGETGTPYIHRDDLVRLVACCLHRDAELGEHEVFMACQKGAVPHNDLFNIIRGAAGRSARPIFVSPTVARIGVYLRQALGAVTRDPPFEHPWMLRYVDRPWVVDPSHTEARLHWTCADGMGVCDRLPAMLDRLARDRHDFRRRNKLRNRGEYEWPDPEV